MRPNELKDIKKPCKAEGTVGLSLQAIPVMLHIVICPIVIIKVLLRAALK